MNVISKGVAVDVPLGFLAGFASGVVASPAELVMTQQQLKGGSVLQNVSWPSRATKTFASEAKLTHFLGRTATKKPRSECQGHKSHALHLFPRLRPHLHPGGPLHRGLFGRRPGVASTPVGGLPDDERGGAPRSGSGGRRCMLGDPLTSAARPDLA